MPTDPKELQFIEAKEETIDNLEVLEQWLEECVGNGMHDPNEMIHNQLLDLIEETTLAGSYPELSEVIAQAKTIEIDLDAWLSQQGKTTVGLIWPRDAQ